MALATPRNNSRVASSPAESDQLEKATRSVNITVISSLSRPRPTRSNTACQTCSAPNPISRAALGESPTNLSAARATARAPPGPETESGSPKDGSPGSCSRALRSAPTISGRWFAAFISVESCPRRIPEPRGVDRSSSEGTGGMVTSGGTPPLSSGSPPPEGVPVTPRAYLSRPTVGGLLIATTCAPSIRQSGHYVGSANG